MRALGAEESLGDVGVEEVLWYEDVGMGREVVWVVGGTWVLGWGRYVSMVVVEGVGFLASTVVRNTLR